MRRSLISSGIVGGLAGFVPGLLLGLGTNFIVLRMRRSKAGRFANFGFVTALGAIGALSFTMWIPIAEYVEVEEFLPRYFLVMILTHVVMTFRVLVRFVEWLGDMI